MSVLKIEYFKNFTTFKKNLPKMQIQNFCKNEDIGEHSICNFSTNLFGGREIAQRGGEILRKVS